MKKIDKITKEEIEQIFSESKSQDSVARKIGYDSNSGSSHSALKRYAEENKIDVSHFTGQGQNKGNIDLTRFRKGVPFSGHYRKELSSKAKGDLCRECLRSLPYRRIQGLPEKEQLEKDIYIMSFEDVGRKYGVTGNAIRKWCKYYGLPYRRADINQILNSHNDT